MSRAAAGVFCLVWLAWAQASGPGGGVSLTVRGDIPAVVILRQSDLSGMSRETVSVAEKDGAKVVYEGVALRDVLRRAGVPSGKELPGKALASYVLAKARDGYAVVFSVGELDPTFGNEAIIIADRQNGKPLSDHMGPLRIVCVNDKAGARSVRMLETLEIVQLGE